MTPDPGRPPSSFSVAEAVVDKRSAGCSRQKPGRNLPCMKSWSLWSVLGLKSGGDHRDHGNPRMT